MAMPSDIGMPDATVRTAGLLVIFIGMWATGAVSEHFALTSFFLLALTVNAAPAEVIFAGFASGAVWLIFGGLIIGIACQKTALAARIAEILCARLPPRYGVLVVAAVLFALTMCFLLPSAMARSVLLPPIAASLALRFGFKEDTRGYTGFVLAMGMTSSQIAYTILPATVPNLAMLGIANTIYGTHLGYADYLVINFPILGLGGSLLIAVLAWSMFREKPREAKVTERARMTRDQTAVISLLIISLVAWTTDSFTGVSPTVVALVAALGCLAPKIGVLTADEVKTKLPLTPWLMVAALIGLSRLVEHSGLGAEIARTVSSAMAFSKSGGAVDFFKLVAIGKATTLGATNMAAPGILTPMARNFAAASNIDMLGVLMTQIPPWVFTIIPYECPPLVNFVLIARVKPRDTFRFAAVFSLTGLAILVPAQYFWLRFLGYVS